MRSAQAAQQLAALLAADRARTPDAWILARAAPAPLPPKPAAAATAPSLGLDGPRIVARFGGARPNGRPSLGLSIQTPPGAAVLAPNAAKVVFAGPLKGYGQVLILDRGGGYALVLTGLSELRAEEGAQVAAGEIVGKMASGSAAIPELYVELRRDGRPIDPQGRLGGRLVRGVKAALGGKALIEPQTGANLAVRSSSRTEISKAPAKKRPA